MINIKLVIGLAAALIISLLINLGQLVWHVKRSTAAPLKAAIVQLEHTAAINTAVAEQRVKDDMLLQVAVAEASASAVTTQTIYRDRVQMLPAAQCAPGVERVDAWNTISIGPPQ